jgi:hypothetical protein
MTVQLNISYETLVELVEQLPIGQQRDLLRRLLEKADDRQLTKEEKKALYHASILGVPVLDAPSIRRQDWYGDRVVLDV